MRKYFVFLIVLMSMTSCITNFSNAGEEVFGIKSVGKTGEKIMFMFHETKFPMIWDDDIIGIDTVSMRGGNLLLVSYYHGTVEATDWCYQDNSGKIIRCKKYTKNTGYPVSDSWWYTINNKGHIRTHYEYLLIVGIILYCLYKMFFCV